MKWMIGPSIAITVLLVGELFLHGKTMPVLFQNVPLSNLIYTFIAAIIVTVFTIFAIRKSNNDDNKGERYE